MCAHMQQARSGVLMPIAFLETEPGLGKKRQCCLLHEPSEGLQELSPVSKFSTGYSWKEEEDSEKERKERKEREGGTEGRGTALPQEAKFSSECWSERARLW